MAGQRARRLTAIPGQIIQLRVGAPCQAGRRTRPAQTSADLRRCRNTSPHSHSARPSEDGADGPPALHRAGRWPMSRRGNTACRAMPAYGKYLLGGVCLAGAAIIAAVWLKFSLRERKDLAQRRANSDPAVPSNLAPLAPPVVAGPSAHADTEAESEPESWREMIRDRRMRLPPQSGLSLRLVVGGVATLIFVSGLVVAAGTHLPATSTAIIARQAVLQASLPTPALYLGLFCAVAAWTLIVSGLLFARWPARLLGLAILFAAALAEWLRFGRISLFASGVGIAGLCGIAGVVLADALAGWRLRRSHARTVIVGRIHWVRSIVLLALVVAPYTYEAIKYARSPPMLFGTLSVVHMLLVTAAFLLPVLFLAGADVADFAFTMADGISERFKSGGILLAATAVAAAVGSLLTSIRDLRTIFVPSLVLCAGMLGVVVVIAATAQPYRRWARPWPTLMTTAVILGAVIAIRLLAVPGQSLIAPGLRPAPASVSYTYSGSPKFSLRHPASCQPSASLSKPDLPVVVFLCTAVTNAGERLAYEFVVEGLPTGSATTVSPREAFRTLLAGHGQERSYHLRSARDAGPWATTMYSGKGVVGEAWARSIRGRIWFITWDTLTSIRQDLDAEA